MPLTAGARLGSYEILSPLGAGGMGEVYKARDTRLDRTVAIKVLASPLAATPELKQRFEREARAISAFSHPHICTLHDIGNDGGVDFLVMEYLEGESLDDLLSHGPLPTDQVLRFAIQIAGALEKAHRQGIIHRDLKPGNVMITQNGAKLLDFGLAKQSVAAGGAQSDLETRTRVKALTAQGTIVGTCQYMAPEQLEGREASARSDIFALGALIYEMASGQAAFSGESQASIIASILKSQPPNISAVVAVSPPALDSLVRGCLAKDPEERWQTVHDVRLQLEAISEEDGASALPAMITSRRWLNERGPWALALGIGMAALLAITQLGRSLPQTPARFLIAPPGNTTLHYGLVSPDGRRLAFVATTNGKTELWTRSLDVLALHVLAGTEGIRRQSAGYAGTFFWSPDSKSIGFFAHGSLKMIEADGGPSQTLCDAPGVDTGAWAPDGTILLAVGQAHDKEGLYRIPATGGTPEKIRLTDENGKDIKFVFWPAMLPDGKHFLFNQDSPDRGELFLRAGVMGSSSTQRIMPVESRVEYAAPGYLLHVRQGTLLAQPFDAGKLRLLGKPAPLAEGLGYYVGTGTANFSTSQTGLLVYQLLEQTSRQLVRVDRAGRDVESIGESMAYDSPRLSPSGRLLVSSIGKPQTSETDLWMHDLARKSMIRLTSEAGQALWPVWSPDGASIVFAADWDGIPHLFLQGLDGAKAIPLLPSGPRVQFPMDWSPDGRFILYAMRDPMNDWDLWALPLQGDKTPIPVADTKFYESQGTFSPDGRWIAYVSDESGAREVYIAPFQHAGERKRVSSEGGAEPRWRHDGRELFYLSGSRMMSVAVRLSDSIELAPPTQLFSPAEPGYDVSTDGKTFIERRPSGPDDSRFPVVMLNWPASLKQ